MSKTISIAFALLCIFSAPGAFAVNNPPQGTDNTKTILEDQSYTFAAADFGFSDPLDMPPNAFLAVKITTLPGAGTLEDNGVSVVAGAFVPVADIMANKLVFTPAANANGTTYASFTFQVQDDGGTADGGVDTDPTPRTFTFDVTGVNDPPIGADKTITILEDAAYTFAVTDFGFSDPNDVPPNNLLAIKITTLPGGGTLKDNGVAVAAGQFVPAADVSGSKLVYTLAPNSNGNGYATFTFQLQDDGGTANGGVDLSAANTVTFNVTAVNDPPSGANAAITTTQNVAYVFASGNFGFSDPNDTPPNALLAVEITTLPAAGTLTDNSMAVSAGQFIPVADINGGLLLYTPPLNATGTPYTTFTFQVQDDGGTANGGIDVDPTPNTITVNVSPVLPPSIAKSFPSAATIETDTWPVPARTQNTEVPCNPCPGYTQTNLVTAGYSSPITTFTGRFLDSQQVGTSQQPFRTARAETVTVAPQLNRIYMMIGSAVVAYDINTFFNRLSRAETLASSTSIPVNPSVGIVRAAPYEQFLQWDKFFYAENGSPWTCPIVDGQQRLFQFDYDDQGYIYLAYSTFGWGIVHDDGGTGGTLMQSLPFANNTCGPQHTQCYNDLTSGKPGQIVSFKSLTGRYYAMISGGKIFDTTDRTNPQLVRTYTFFQEVAKDSTSTRLAIVNATGGLEIWRTDDLIAGGAPIATFSSGTANGYSLVTSDGTNFYADAFDSSHVTIGTIRFDGSTYTQSLYPTSVGIYRQAAFASGFHFGAGFICISGIGTDGHWDMALLKMDNGVPSVVSLNGYIEHYYSASPDANHVTPAYTNIDDAVVYTSGSHTYLILEIGGLGDVYEINGTAGLSLSRVPRPASTMTPALAVGATTRLSFTITNPNATLAMTGVAFNDPMPAGLAVANPNGLSGSCGAGMITTTATSVALSGGTIPANSNCTFSVNVTGTAYGTQVNTTGSVTSTNAGSGGTAQASIIVLGADLIVSKSHSGSFLQGQTGTYKIIVSNIGNAPTSGTVSVQDNLPAGLTVNAMSGTGWTCDTNTATCTRSDALNPSGTYPEIDLVVNVAADAPFATNMVTVSGGGDSNLTNNTASDPTTVLTPEAPPIISVDFNPSQIAVNEATNLIFTIKNPAANPGVLTGVSFTDTLPLGLTLSNESGGVCDGMVTVTAPRTIAFSGMTISPGSQCVFFVTVTGAAPGNYSNVTSAPTSSNSSAGSPAGAAITVGVFSAGDVVAKGDFNGDGMADVLLRDVNGNFGMWLMNGPTITSGAFVGSPGVGYSVAGIGDFNGDGKADILLRDINGNLGMWLMNGPNIISGAFVGSPGAGYSVVGIGDFNGDGKADILLRDTNGNIGMWLMNGPVIAGGALVGSPGGYSVAAVGDFDGDGKADILLRDQNGNFGMWLMNGPNIVGGALVGSPGSTYVVAGVGDFNGDGKCDILLRDGLGNLGMWLMNGASITGGGFIPGASAYTITGVRDYDGDGKADLLFRDVNGTIGMWKMNGPVITSGALVGSPGTGYFAY